MAASMRQLAFSNLNRICSTFDLCFRTANLGRWYKNTRPSFHTAAYLNSAVRYRKVHETTEGDSTTVEAEYVTSEPGTTALSEEYKDACPICRLNLKVTYKDVLILKQFIKEDGSMLSKRITGVCPKQHLNLVECIKRAHRAGLLPDHRPKKKMVLPPGVNGKRKHGLPRF